MPLVLAAISKSYQAPFLTVTTRQCNTTHTAAQKMTHLQLCSGTIRGEMLCIGFMIWQGRVHRGLVSLKECIQIFCPQCRFKSSVPHICLSPVASQPRFLVSFYWLWMRSGLLWLGVGDSVPIITTGLGTISRFLHLFHHYWIIYEVEQPVAAAAMCAGLVMANRFQPRQSNLCNLIDSLWPDHKWYSDNIYGYYW